MTEELELEEKIKPETPEQVVGIDKPHDSLWKQGMREVRVAREILESRYPPEILKHFDPSSMEITKSSYIDAEFKPSCSDVVYRMKSDFGDSYVYILAEHQSTPDRHMTLRMVQYTHRLIEDHISQDNKHYPIVFPILYYNGKTTPYPYSTDFFDYFENPKLAKAIMLKPFEVVDLSHISDAELLKHPWSCYMLGLFKYNRLKRDFTAFFQKMANCGIIMHLEGQNGGKYLGRMVYYTLKEATLVSKNQFAKLLYEQSKLLGDKAMSILDKNTHHVTQQVTQQLNQRHHMQIEKIAIKMLRRKNVSIRQIHEDTGLPEKEIRRLAKETLH